MKEVDFFIVGAAKSATTALAAYLKQHPDICMSSIKEPNYFTSEAILNQKLYYKDAPLTKTEPEYQALFSSCDQRKRWGEASVSYLFYPETAKKIREYNRDAKIIIVLRNPMERAYSHYLMDKRLGLTDGTFEDLVFIKKNPLFIQQYLEYGNYSSQLINYFNHFPKEQIHIILNEDLMNDPERIMVDFFKFLDVDLEFKPDFSTRHNESLQGKNGLLRYFYRITWLRKISKAMLPEKIIRRIINRYFVRQPDTLSIELRQKLQAYFKNGVKQTEQLISRDLSHWLDEK